MVREYVAPPSPSTRWEHIALKRTPPSSRIVDGLKSLAHQRFVKMVDGEKTFFWPAKVDPAAWVNFRVSNDDETSGRHIDDLAIEEVGTVMRHRAGIVTDDFDNVTGILVAARNRSRSTRTAGHDEPERAVMLDRNT